MMLPMFSLPLMSARQRCIIGHLLPRPTMSRPYSQPMLVMLVQHLQAPSLRSSSLPHPIPFTLARHSWSYLRCYMQAQRSILTFSRNGVICPLGTASSEVPLESTLTLEHLMAATSLVFICFTVMGLGIPLPGVSDSF